jgi:16S rRNA pseudouridine516 synthase
LRLDRYLANMGCGSRSEVKLLIKNGKATINAVMIKDPAFQVSPDHDQVCLNGQPIVFQRFFYLMMNKPAGVITATEDLKATTVLDLIETRYHNKDIVPVGRLDKDTEGLLLLTNDGELNHNLLSPKKHVDKCYFAKIDGWVTSGDQEAFAKGIVLDDGYCTLPGKLEVTFEGPISEVMITIREGKFHQIKRMFQALGKKVLYLKRISMGSLVLDPDLAPGEYRELTKDEIEALTR